QGSFSFEISEILDGPDGEAYGEGRPLGANDEFWLKIEWELDNDHNYLAGSNERIQLPPEIKIHEAITDGELLDSNGNLVTTYEVDVNGLITLTFTDFIENNNDVSGWIEILSQLDKDNVQEEDGKITISPIGEEGNLTIPLDNSGIEKTADKQ